MKERKLQQRNRRCKEEPGGNFRNENTITEITKLLSGWAQWQNRRDKREKNQQTKRKRNRNCTNE